MNKVRILGARLSTNPDTKKVNHEQGLAGFVNATENGKLFYVVDCMVHKGIVPVRKSQLVWADDNGRFPVSVEDYNTYSRGQELQGKLVTFNDMPEYEVDGKKFTHVELLVMDGQDEATIANNWAKRQIAQNGGESGERGNGTKLGLNTTGIGKAVTPAAGGGTAKATT